MPLPKPGKSEPKDDFLDRCMADDAINDEYPDAAQRRAVCERQWDDGQQEEGAMESTDVRYHHILTALLSSVWAILPEKLAIIMEMLRFRAAGGAFTAEEIRERIGAAAGPRRGGVGTVAVIPVVGTIVARGGMLLESSGAVSVQRITAQFRQALVDPEVSSIVLDFDSPGGEVSGVPELADELYGARGGKPVLAVANTLAASAGFWLAAQASEFYASPSAEVGSLGVYAVHEDVSGMMARRGVQPTLISAEVGPHKTELSPFAPLSDEARRHVQDRVDEYGRMFVDAAARGRGVTTAEARARFGGGRVLGAKAAKAAGMVDGVKTLDEVIAMADRRARQRQRAAAELEIRRMRAALR